MALRESWRRYSFWANRGDEGRIDIFDDVQLDGNGSINVTRDEGDTKKRHDRQTNR